MDPIDQQIAEWRAKGLVVTKGPKVQTLTDAGTQGQPVRELLKRGAQEIAEELLATVKRMGFGTPKPEHTFHPTRKWQFDWAWLRLKVALEREGGTFRRLACKGCGRVAGRFMSRHHDRKGLESDAEKYNAAAAMGWAVIRATPEMMQDGRALHALLAVLASRKGSK